MTLSVRNRRLTAALDLKGKGIEWGPLHRTILRKSEYSVRYADYAGRDQLAAHYAKSANVDVRLIPEIDIVTGGRPISEFVDLNSVDYVIASHVMEHVPDFLGWLESNLSILRPGGCFAVAYPDKRYCFDMRRRSTIVSDLLSAYIEKRTKPSFAQICDHFYNVVKTTPSEAWESIATQKDRPYLFSRDRIVPMLRTKYKEDSYVDCHCWIFEDLEAINILEAVRGFFPIKFDVIAFSPTPKNGAEFHFTIQKANP